MPNLTPFEIALLILGAVLVAALRGVCWADGGCVFQMGCCYVR